MRSAKDIPVSIFGTGYSSEELLRILLRHPHVTLDRIYGHTTAGKNISEIFPAFSDVLDRQIEPYEPGSPNDSDIVFVALPSGQAMHIVPDLLKAGKRVIDLGGDYRLRNATTYKTYYGQEHTSPHLADAAVYGIPELHGEAVAGSMLVANPGCYPTSILVPLAPLLKDRLIKTDGIVINSLSGVTGAGKKETLEMSFAEIDSSVRAYKVGGHQHQPEIEQVLTTFAGASVSVTFTPHLLPLRRGIYTTIVADLEEAVTSTDIEHTLNAYYRSKYFVRLCGARTPELKHVVHSNFIDIGWHVDREKQKVIILSALDNLLKGAAGQAIQNMNLLLGLPEETALRLAA